MTKALDFRVEPPTIGYLDPSFLVNLILGTSDLTWGTVVLGDANNAAITTFDLEDGSIVVR